eukprot:6173584-Pleurochrysis_carterae.AAC.2
MPVTPSVLLPMQVSETESMNQVIPDWTSSNCLVVTDCISTSAHGHQSPITSATDSDGAFDGEAAGRIHAWKYHKWPGWAPSPCSPARRFGRGARGAVAPRPSLPRDGSVARAEMINSSMRSQEELSEDQYENVYDHAYFCVSCRIGGAHN